MIPGFFASGASGYVPPPTPWTPADIATQLWLDASDASGRTIVSSAFSEILDKSGNGQTFSQTVSGRRPELVSAGLNGLDVMGFDGTTKGLIVSSNIVGRNVSSLVMAFLVRPDVVNQDRRLWNSTTALTGDAARLLVGFNSSGSWRVGGRRLDAGTYAESTSVAATAGQWVIMVACFDYANATLALRLNGSVASSGAFLNAGSTSDTNSQRAGFGAGLNADNFNTSGRMAELVVATSLSDVEKIEGYIAHKWGQAGSLPIGHPYKGAPPTA